MPKMKTHSGMKKRVTRTGSGKLVHNQAGTTHLNEHKSSKRKRRLAGVEVLEGGDAKKVAKLLGKYKGK